MKVNIMKSRRSFIIKMGTGALSAYALSSFAGVSQVLASDFKDKQENKKKICIGIIGAENTHTVGYGRMFNIDKQFPGIEVGYVWGETEEFARNAMDKGGIPEMVKDPNEMLGKIDALIVDHRHAKYHLAAATPFIKAGIPSFIDKPFCYRAQEGKNFLLMAREHGTPVTSYSSIAQSKSNLDMKIQVETFKKIHQVVCYGPVDIESRWGGIFFYGVHLIQPLMNIFGEDIKKVRITRDGAKANATLIYGNGMVASLIFSNFNTGWRTFVETESGFHELISRVEPDDPAKNYKDMVQMFRTGEEPRRYQSMLNCVSVLEALERSVGNQKWENVDYEEI